MQFNKGGVKPLRSIHLCTIIDLLRHLRIGFTIENCPQLHHVSDVFLEATEYGSFYISVTVDFPP